MSEDVLHREYTRGIRGVLTFSEQLAHGRSVSIKLVIDLLAQLSLDEIRLLVIAHLL